METLNIVLNPITQATEPVRNKFVDALVDALMKPFIVLLKVGHVWNYHQDIEKVRSDRSKVIWEEANKRKIPMEGISVFGKPIEQYRALINGKWHHFQSLPIPSHFNFSSYAWIDDKGKLRYFLQQRSLPVAYGGFAGTVNEALSIFNNGTPPFSVKPRLGSRGR